MSGTANLGGTATLTATLISTTTSVGIPGETVSFALDSIAVGTAVTNSSGVAILSGVPTSDPIGSDPGGVFASFAGDSNYLASSGTGDLIVTLKAIINSENSKACNSTSNENLTCSIATPENQANIQNTEMTVENEVTRPKADVVLTPSVNILALSVKNTELNNALTGNPRKITLVNHSNTTAYNVKIKSSDLPTDTIITSSNCDIIPANTTCILTVTPGTSPSTTIYTPTPQTTASTITISGDNTNILTVQIYVLTYGSVYQSGFVFSVDDTTPKTVSVGGKIAALKDQPPAEGIVWGYYNESAASDVNYVRLLGIDELSIIFPPASTSQQVPADSIVYSACNGNLDGNCNTHKIVNYYETDAATRSDIKTPLAYYAAALCHAIINDYRDWYLPAICEMGYYSGDFLDAGCGTMESPMLQNIQSNLVDRSILSGLATTGGYWSSTQASTDPQSKAWYQLFASNDSSYQNFDAKNSELGVRCIRALTFEEPSHNFK